MSLLIFALPVVAQAEPEALFTFIGNAGPPTEPVDAGATMSWPVKINIPLLITLPDKLIANVPNHSPVLLARKLGKDKGDGWYEWYGHGDRCDAYFDLFPGFFIGSVHCLNATYAVYGDPEVGTMPLNYYDPNLMPEYDDGPAGPRPTTVYFAANSGRA